VSGKKRNLKKISGIRILPWRSKTSSEEGTQSSKVKLELLTGTIGNLTGKRRNFPGFKCLNARITSGRSFVKRNSNQVT